MANLSKSDAFKKAIEDMNKHISKMYKEDDTVVSLFGDRQQKVETISTGSLVLDTILGGGFPRGRIIELFGPEASGKTSFALTASGNVQREGGNVAFIDLEHALNPAHAVKLGVDIESIALSQPSHAEEALDLILMMAESGMVDLIVVDSIAAMIPQAELEGNMQDQTMALVARLLSRQLKKIAQAASKSGSTVLFINQIREKVGVMMGSPEMTPGGKAMKYTASQRIRISRTGSVTEGKEAVGNHIKLKVTKNKIAPPFKEGETVLSFQHGIDVASELAEIGPRHGAIEKPTIRSWVDPTTGEKFAGSKQEAIDTLKSDPELLDRISNKLYSILNEDTFTDDSVGEEFTEEEIADGSEDDEEEIEYDKETGEVITTDDDKS